MNNKPSLTTEQIAKLPKWAQAAFNALVDSEAESRALCWPSLPEPPCLTKDEITASRDPITGLFVGWHFVAYNMQARVEQGCSNGTFHCTSRIDLTTSQGHGTFYRTRSDAYLAARWALCRAAAKALLLVDRRATGTVTYCNA